jgi:hypothetical protein
MKLTGIEKLNCENPHFMRQTIAVLAGFVVLAASLFFHKITAFGR